MPVKGIYCVATFSWVGNATAAFRKFSGSIPASIQVALLK